MINSKRFVFVAITLVAFLAVACTETQTVTLVSGHVRVHAEVARTRAELSKGLMARGSLGQNDGMLFVFPDERYLSFWMKDTLIPLSIAYLSSDGRILEIHDMYPMDLSSVDSAVKARYALEVNQGWFADNGLRVGDRFEMPEGL